MKMGGQQRVNPSKRRHTYAQSTTWTSEILAVEHIFAVQEDLSKEMDFLQATTSYSVWKDWNNDHAEFDVFLSNYMKDMTKALDKGMKPGSHRNMVQLRYTTCLLIRRSCFWKSKDDARTMEEYGRATSDSEES